MASDPGERRQYRCSHCDGVGHNVRGCPIRRKQRDKVLAEVATEVRLREELIRSLQGQLERESTRAVEIEQRLEIERAEQRAVFRQLGRQEERVQSPLWKVVPSVLGAAGSGLSFLTHWFERVPHAERFGMALLVLVPGVVAFSAAEYGRRLLMRSLARQRLEEIPASAQSAKPRG